MAALTFPTPPPEQESCPRNPTATTRPGVKYKHNDLHYSTPYQAWSTATVWARPCAPSSPTWPPRSSTRRRRAGPAELAYRLTAATTTTRSPKPSASISAIPSNAALRYAEQVATPAPSPTMPPSTSTTREYNSQHRRQTAHDKNFKMTTPTTNTANDCPTSYPSTSSSLHEKGKVTSLSTRTMGRPGVRHTARPSTTPHPSTGIHTSSPGRDALLKKNRVQTISGNPAPPPIPALSPWPFSSSTHPNRTQTFCQLQYQRPHLSYTIARQKPA